MVHPWPVRFRNPKFALSGKDVTTFSCASAESDESFVIFVILCKGRFLFLCCVWSLVLLLYFTRKEVRGLTMGYFFACSR